MSADAFVSYKIFMYLGLRQFRCLMGLFFVWALSAEAAVVNATWNSATDVPVTASSYTATGNTVNFTLNFAPAVGASLTVVNNTGLPFISGTFGNLAQGQAVMLSYNGLSYSYVAHYYGGTGNDLVLAWAGRRPVSWGYNNYGQLGNGTSANGAVPSAVTVSGTPLAGRTILELATGSEHSLALCSDGSMVSWGYDGNGQLGTGFYSTSTVPVAVKTAGTPLDGKVVAAISTGYQHNLALCADGTLACWGYNAYGELGSGDNVNSGVPKAVATAGTSLEGKTVIAISAGGLHNIVLCSDGTLHAWGDNYDGQLGMGTAGSDQLVPVAVKVAGTPLQGRTITAMAAGGNHNLVLCSDGTLVTWGDNTYGQLGNSVSSYSSVPVAVSVTGTPLQGKAVVALAAGQHHSMVLCSDGTVVSWGYNLYGQLGNNSTSNSSVPVAVTTAGTALAGKNVVGITAGYYHSGATCSDGGVVTWGYNAYGQLGNNGGSNSSVPVAAGTGLLQPRECFILATCGQSAYHNLGLIAEPAPAVTTLPAASVAGTMATLNGAVNANGGTTVAYFDYGLDASYGTTITSSPTTVTGSANIAVSAALKGLMPATTYHFRINTLSFGNPIYGADQTFTTANTSLSGLTVSASSLSPAFNPVVYNYAVYVGSDVTSITVSPATADGNARVSVNGSPVNSGSASSAVLLTGVSTTINIVVTAADQISTQTYSVIVLKADPNSLTAYYSSRGNVPATSNGFTARGLHVNFALNYAPLPGTTLMVVNNTGLSFIDGTFSNLAQGQVVSLSYGWVTYKFVASYYGGSGNDLVLTWAGVRPVAWGYNAHLQLGVQIGRGGGNSLVPVSVTTASTPLANRTVLSLSCGGLHSLALCSDGSMASWGEGNHGQLGNNATLAFLQPMAVMTTGTPLAGKVISAISAGDAHNLALATDGTLASWGYNSNGQLGNNNTTQCNVPVAVTTAGTPLEGKSVAAVDAGGTHSLVLCTDGTVFTWGQNSSGQLGNNNTMDSSVPVAVTTNGTVLAGKTVVALAAGGAFNLALCSDGNLVTWGANDRGQLGNNTTTYSSVPVAVTSEGTVLVGKTIVALAAGGSHCLVLFSDGTLAAWGRNDYGQLGINSTLQSNVPVMVTMAGTALDDKTVVAISAGAFHSVATCSDGTVVTWGYNHDGELGINSTANSRVPLAVSSSTLAVGEVLASAVSGLTAEHNLALVATPAPAATTLSPTSVGGVTTTLKGTVNANGGNAAVSFDYGLDATYGTNVAGSPAFITGSSDTTVSVMLTGLVPATTYHYRVNAAGGSGSASGGDMTFTTPDTNASLASLALNPGMLAPTFAGNVLGYSVAVPNATASFTVTASTMSNGAAMTVNGTALVSGATSTPVAFVGNTAAVSIVVTAQDGATTETYIVNLFRNTLYLDWAAANNLSGANTADTGDADGDGIPNLLEYALNLSPTAASKLPTSTTINGGNYEYTYTRSTAAVNGGTTFTVECSPSLSAGSWSSNGITQTVLSDDGTTQQVKAVIPINAATSMFVHLSVTAPP